MFGDDVRNDFEVDVLDEFEPEFLDYKELSQEQLTDPDYSFRQLVRISDGKLIIPCAKCHHCR